MVSTSVGAEGLEAVDGKDILIANTPESFANSVGQLMADDALRSTIAKNAYELAASKFSSAAVKPKIQYMFEEIARKRWKRDRSS